MKPIYNSNKGQLQSPKRRRLGEMPKHLREQLNNLSKWERICLDVNSL